MDYKVTQKILNHAQEFWSYDDKAYWKYTGKYWQLIFLGLFLADGQDSRVIPGVESILNHRKWVIASGAQCLTANILKASIQLGYGDHPAVVEETEALARRILNDQGIKCTALGYSLLSRCHMALPKLLLCFAEIPVEKRSSAVKNAIKWISKELINKHVYRYVPGTNKAWQKVLSGAPKRADLPEGQTVKGWIKGRRTSFLETQGLASPSPKQGWLKFGFPLHYNSDILEAMYALALVGTPMHAHLHDPLQVIRNKKTPEGHWKLENSLNGKMWADVEEKGKPSKWITYFAIFVLNYFTI